MSFPMGVYEFIIYHFYHLHGVCAETSAAFSIFLATHFGVPVSTTHVITGAISGVGSAVRFSAVRWGVTVRIVWAWVFTIPATALLGGLVYFLCGMVAFN